MRNRLEAGLETVRDNVITIGKRALGIDIYQAYTAQFEPETQWSEDKVKYEKGRQRLVGGVGLTLRAIVPLTSRFFFPIVEVKPEGNPFPRMENFPTSEGLRTGIFSAGIAYSVFATDIAGWVLVGNTSSDNPLKAVGIAFGTKLAINVASHVGLDVIGAGVEKWRNSRLPTNTLAV